MYHSKKAKTAQDYFVKTFSKKEILFNLPGFKPNKYDIVSILIETKLTSSKSEARRIIKQGGVKIDGKVIKDIHHIVPLNSVL